MPQMTISGDHIRTVITDYIAAFEKGDSSRFTELFKAPNNVNTQYLDNVLMNFNYVVNNSDNRKVNLEGLVWKYQKNSAIGQGKYYAEAQLKNNLGLQTLNADMEIVIQQVENVPYISSFKLQKPKLKIPTKAVPALPLDLTSVDVMAPSGQELQYLISRFINTFEDGDIDAMTALFADNVISNNKNSLAGLKEEFEQLFATSTSRQVFIKKLKWDYTKNYAKGSGKIDIFATKNTGDIVQMIKGKVKIIAKRINNQVLITHYYHS